MQFQFVGAPTRIGPNLSNNSKKTAFGPMGEVRPELRSKGKRKGKKVSDLFEKLVDLSILVGDMEARAEAFMAEDLSGRERILAHMKSSLIGQRQTVLKDLSGSLHFNSVPWAQILRVLQATQLVEAWDLEQDSSWSTKGVMIDDLFERATLTLEFAHLLVNEAEFSVAEAVHIDLSDAPGGAK